MYPFDADAMLSVAHDVQQTRIAQAELRRLRQSDRSGSAAAHTTAEERSGWVFALATVAGLLPDRHATRGFSVRDDAARRSPVPAR